MCIIHDQKMACGCWRKPDAEVTICSTALRNVEPTTDKPISCPREECNAAILPSFWYCINHTPCKQFAGRGSEGNYEALKKNLSGEAVAHVLRTGGKSFSFKYRRGCQLMCSIDYDFPLRPPSDRGDDDQPASVLVHETMCNGSTLRKESEATMVKRSNEGLEVQGEVVATREMGGKVERPAPTGYRSSQMPGGYTAFTPGSSPAY